VFKDKQHFMTHNDVKRIPNNSRFQTLSSCHAAQSQNLRVGLLLHTSLKDDSDIRRQEVIFVQH